MSTKALTKAAAKRQNLNDPSLLTALQNGEIKVFDTATAGFITVGGVALTSYVADVDTDAAYTPDTEVIGDGYYHESEHRSAPYFDLEIDGITRLDVAF